MSPLVNQSQDPSHDALHGTNCGTNANATVGGYQDRCGYGPRQPLLVVSPFAKRNAVDHSITDQTSILRFIEGNWHTSRIGNASFDAKAGTLDGLLDLHSGTGDHPRRVILDPATGQPMQPGQDHAQQQAGDRS